MVGHRWSYTAVPLVSAIVLPLILFGLAAWNDYRQLIAQTEAEVRRTVATLKEHSEKVFETAEIVSDRARDLIQGRDWAAVSADEREVHHALHDMAKRLPQISNIILIDETGKIRVQASSYPAPVDTNLADRSYFSKHKAGDDAILVDEARVGRVSNSHIFGLSRRLSGARGDFKGVIYIGILPRYFVGIWGGLLGDRESSAALVRSDGVVLARSPQLSPDLATNPASSSFVQATRASEQGLFTTESRLDPTVRLMGYQKLTSVPVFVTYGHSYAAIWRTWYRNILWFAVVAALSIAALVAITAFSLKRVTAERAALKTLIAEQKRREAAEASLLHAQKLEMLGILTGSIAHDFGNLLQITQGVLEHLRGRLGDARLEQRVAIALSAVEKGGRLTGQLLAFSRKQAIAPARVEPNSVLQNMMPMLAQASRSGISFETKFDAEVWPINIDVAQVELALLNIVTNARHAMPEGGTLRIETRNCSFNQPGPDGLLGDFVAISIADTGTGMPPEIATRVFEPFFTTKSIGNGTGLGLAQVYGVAKQLGGGVAVASEVGHGTTFTLYFPKATESLETPANVSNVVLLRPA